MALFAFAGDTIDATITQKTRYVRDMNRVNKRHRDHREFLSFKLDPPELLAPLEPLTRAPRLTLKTAENR